MKKVRVEDAVGMQLCHDITAMFDGFKGAAFKRGHVIREEDIPKLLDYGKQHIFVWEDTAGEIHEEDAARRLAAMVPAAGWQCSEPNEGKIVFTAQERGMFRVNTALLRKINSIGDITITTLPDHYPVEIGARLASMRIVPIVTKEIQIIEAEELCKNTQLMELRPYKSRKVGIIITGSEVYHGRIKDKFEMVLRRKLKAFPSEICGVSICDDDLNMIVSAAREHIAAGADILIFTGGMSVDPDDLTPTAIRQLGAEIITHGLPSQPGNMTLVGYLGGIAILGVPGAAISMPTTTFDVLLPQIFTGDKFTKAELVNLGSGGLCQLCKSCHWPNCSFGRY